MFSATKFVVAGAIVALFGGFLLAGVLTTQPSDDSVPAAGTAGPGTFGPAGTLNVPRAGHSATLLPDGRVLVVGGGRVGFEPAEVWDPATETSSPAGSLADARDGRTATLLPDGRVLLVGGRGLYGPSLSVEEVWDPATSAFGPAGSIVETREEHTATLLPDGRVLIIGGRGTDGDLASTEFWDPATESFASAGSLAEARWGHTATLLPDGRVLVIGGWSSGIDHDIASAEVWDPATESFTPAGSLAEARALHTATMLPDGRVLVVAGQDADDFVRTLAEVWDPATESFSAAGSLSEARRDHAAAVLPDGRVLVVGGSGDGLTPLASTELWDPATETFGQAAMLAEARASHTMTLLPDGRVLALGGVGRDGSVASTEVWASGTGQPRAEDDKADLVPAEAEATDPSLADDLPASDAPITPDLLPGVDLVTKEVEPSVTSDPVLMAPALFTMRLEDGQGGDAGTRTVTEEGYTLVTGATSFARVLDPTDPRMSGVYTSEANRVERDDGYPGLLTILFEIRNEGGRWVGTSHSVGSCLLDPCPDSPAADFPAATSIVFTGMDGYDGLTAYVVAANGWTADGTTADGSAYSPDDGLPMVGMIVPGEMPPAYELPVSICTDQYTETQCEWQEEWIDAS